MTFCAGLLRLIAAAGACDKRSPSWCRMTRPSDWTVWRSSSMMSGRFRTGNEARPIVADPHEARLVLVARDEAAAVRHDDGARAERGGGSGRGVDVLHGGRE